MSTKQHDPSSQASDEKKPRRKKTPTFQVELPVEVSEQQAKSLHTNFEAARQVYNAILSLGLQRLQRMRADPGWNQARASPRTWKAERKEAFAALREKHDFTDYALQEAAKRLRVGPPGRTHRSCRLPGVGYSRLSLVATDGTWTSQKGAV
jgi:hypothetical protein